MGRNSTGARSTVEAQRLEIGYFIKRGYFKCFGVRYGSHTQLLSWDDGSKISIETVHSATETYLRLFYTITDLQTGVKTNLDYKVLIDFVPSNLGKGSVLYFLCPVSSRRCRILYRAYGSYYFKAREAYNPRLYYKAQTATKKMRLFAKYDTIQNKLDGYFENAKRYQTTFKGKPTKRALKNEQFEKRLSEYDETIQDYFINIFSNL